MNSLLYSIGLTLIFVGLLVIIVGFILEMIRGEEQRNQQQRKSEYGGVIFIGPIPIVFGSNKDIAKTMLIIAFVIFLFIIILFLISYL
ncbi:MAG: DUF131 domain-containing protein [Sulfolobus sp.]